MRLQEYVLQQVFGILRSPDHTQQQTVKTGGVRAIEFLERTGVALLAAPHQIKVGGLHVS